MAVECSETPWSRRTSSGAGRPSRASSNPRRGRLERALSPCREASKKHMPGIEKNQHTLSEALSDYHAACLGRGLYS